jgi:hypothetical protein
MSDQFEIKNSELEKARNYIESKFAAQSWWPKAEPEEAKREYYLLKDNITSLNLWCKKWLDAGQQRQLIKAIKS